MNIMIIVQVMCNLFAGVYNEYYDYIQVMCSVFAGVYNEYYDYCVGYVQCICWSLQ